MEIKGNTLIKKSSDLMEASLGESLALMSVESGKYFGMNQVAKHIWQELGSEISVENLIKNLTEKFDVDRQTCYDECEEFLRKLLEKKMISLRYAG
ncbi:MAG: hypothetical protein Roseis3KO_01660 [Roseivirga sp.]